MDSVNTKNLSLLEAASLVAGLGIGGGILAVPYLASLNGAYPILLITGIAFLASIALHLMIAEMVLVDGDDLQLIELLGRYVFKGRFGKYLLWTFFVLIVITTIAPLAAFLVACGEVLTKLFPLQLWQGEVISYCVAAGVVFFGLKAIALSEKYAILGIICLLVVLYIGASRVETFPIPTTKGGIKEHLALYGMMMFSFSCFFSISQTVKGLSWNRKLIPTAIIYGLTINLIIVLALTYLALKVSPQVTSDAVLGIGMAIGDWALIAGSFFVFLAILSSYWGISYALAIMIKERVGQLPMNICWLLATLPSFILALSQAADFIGFLRLAAGASGFLVALLIVPGMRSAKRAKHSLGGLPGRAFQWLHQILPQTLIIIAYIAMLLGSIIPL